MSILEPVSDMIIGYGILIVFMLYLVLKTK